MHGVFAIGSKTCAHMREKGGGGAGWGRIEKKREEKNMLDIQGSLRGHRIEVLTLFLDSLSHPRDQDMCLNRRILPFQKNTCEQQCMVSWESVIYYNQLVVSQNCALIRTAGTGVSYIQLACTRNSTCCMDVDGVNEQWHIILRGKRFQNNGVEEDLSFKNAHNNRS